MAALLRKYAVATHVYIPIIKRAVVDYAVSADWTPAAGDVKISIDGGAAANVANLPTAITMGNGAVWDFSLTSGELTGKKIMVTVVDAATKAVEDQSFILETYGNASAEHVLDLSVSVETQVWDALLSGHNVNNSFGQIFQAVHVGLAQGGAAGYIDLQTTAPSTDDAVNNAFVFVVSGTGAGQNGRTISDYTGSSRRALVFPNWVTAPDSTSRYVVFPAGAGASPWDDVRSAHAIVGSFGEGVLVQALNTLARADVNAEVVDVLRVDQISELTGPPSATPTVAQALQALLMALRNRLDVNKTSNELKLYNDAGTVIAKKTLSDDGAIYSEAKMVAGP